jgi:hypothetical protein
MPNRWSAAGLAGGVLGLSVSGHVRPTLRTVDKRRNSAARQRRLVAQLEAMGHTVTLEPAA